MMFTDSPFERLMKELPGSSTNFKQKGLPENHPCYGCGNAMALQPCLLPCWKTGKWGPPGPIPDDPPEDEDEGWPFDESEYEY